ncbi:MAG TPA: response regulator [Acidimicrobiales bacterium]|nr:response regulator [Acidimicrobiales bacterium]
MLVSDDENDIRFLLRSALERAGFEVHETGNGRETFEAALEIHPTVITTDILEPCVSGLDALDMLKAEHTTRDIPVIVVTCMHDPAHRNKAFALGAAEYMTKPLSLSAYLRSVESVAARR